MKKKNKQKPKGFDQAFDEGRVMVDFSHGIMTDGLSKHVKLPPIDIPSWMAIEIDQLAKLQGNTRSAVIRQLLVESLRKKYNLAS